MKTSHQHKSLFVWSHVLVLIISCGTVQERRIEKTTYVQAFITGFESVLFPYTRARNSTACISCSHHHACATACVTNTLRVCGPMIQRTKRSLPPYLPAHNKPKKFGQLLADEDFPAVDRAGNDRGRLDYVQRDFNENVFPVETSRCG